MSAVPSSQSSWLVRTALRLSAWAERWFPDAYIFAALAVIIVAIAAMSFGATPMTTATSFGDGFWSLIPFTMQMAFIVIGGYVVASSPPVARLIAGTRIAAAQRTRRGRLRRADFDARLAAELGFQPDLRRIARARAGATRGIAHGLPRGGCGGISRTRRVVGDGLVFVGGAVAGESGEHPETAARHHRRDSRSAKRSSRGNRPR